MKKSLLFLLTLIFLGQLSAHAQALVKSFPTTNNLVHTVVKDGNRLYVGGDFDYIGPYQPYGNSVDATTGAPNSAFAHPNGVVYTSVPDGSGGWYIGGSFTQVGTQARDGIARLNADGTVNVWNPGATGGEVRTLAVNGNTIYIGGTFTQAGGQARSHIAALDATTGLATAWNPGTSGRTGRVSVLTINGNTLYVGGEFTNVAALSRNCIASFDLTTGNLNAWNPGIGFATSSVTPMVNAIVVGNNTVYAGGKFDQSGGQTRSGLAALNPTTGATLSWNPTTDEIQIGAVMALLYYNNRVYIGGTFTNLDNYNRGGLGAVDATTGALDGWAPMPYPNGIAGTGVYCLTMVGNTIYIGGFFVNLYGSSGISRYSVAAVDPIIGINTNFVSHTDGIVRTITPSGGRFYIGGDFVSAGGQPRRYLAAVDATTNAILDWNPTPRLLNTVNAIAIDGTTIYAGGRIASNQAVTAYNTVTGAQTSFNSSNAIPNYRSGDAVNALVISNGKLIIGGSFDYQSGSNDPSNLVAIDLATGNRSAWNPGVVNNAVRSLSASGGLVYVGGFFTSINGQARNHLAALSDNNASVTSWNPDVTGIAVTSIFINGSTAYLGGAFTAVGAQPRANLAAVNLSTGVPTSWTANTDNVVDAVYVNGGNVTVGGAFTHIGGQARMALASVDAATGAVSPWNNSFTSWSTEPPEAYTVLDDGSKVYTGGNLYTVNGEPRHMLLAFTSVSNTPLPVRLLSFTARPEAAASGWRVQCNWVTASEQNSRDFVIERSTDGRNYEAVGTVAALGSASGPHNYVFTDPAALQGLSYYRLRQVDVDGRSSYSPIAIVTINSSAGVVLMYPNPVHDVATVTVSVPQKQAASYSIVNAGGSRVREGLWQLSAGSNTFSLLTTGLPAGTYTLVIHAQTPLRQTTFVRY